MHCGSKLRELDKVAAAISELDTFCRDRGIVLVVVLIPDKPQVYRDYIPGRLNPSWDAMPPSCLWAIEETLAIDTEELEPGTYTVQVNDATMDEERTAATLTIE